MSPENTSASCTATASGMLAASVAANSELRMTPPASRLPTVSGADSMREAKLPSGLRSTTRRWKRSLSSQPSGPSGAPGGGRPWPSADMERPMRPSRFWRTALSARKKAAAAGRQRPGAAGCSPAVSAPRVTSERYSEKPGPSTRADSGSPSASDCGLGHGVMGSSAGLGPARPRQSHAAAGGQQQRCQGGGNAFRWV